MKKKIAKIVGAVVAALGVIAGVVCFWKKRKNVH